MTYSLPLTKIGRALYEQRDQHVEKAVIFLVEQIGVNEWNRRRTAINERLRQRLEPDPRTTPDEGISVRDRQDEIGWYVYLCELSIADPPAVETDQANRILPYIAAFGRKLDAIRAIRGIEARLERMLRELHQQDPDQALFEVLVGATYAEEGWDVEVLPETPSQKSADLLIKRGLRRFEVECKRLTRRADYTTRERDAWLRQWKAVSQWLVSRRLQLIFTVEFSVELLSLPANYVFEAISRNIDSLMLGKEFRDDRCMISAAPVESERISAHMKKNWVKRNSSFERQLLTGRYERDYGLTYVVGGQSGSMGERDVAGNSYWDSIDYVSGAYWRCRAPEALNAKARDIRKRLADATAQFSGQVGGVVHIGVETGEGDDVEAIRSGKIVETVTTFDPKGQPLEWIFIHFLRGESLPDGGWAIDETCHWRGHQEEFFKPLRTSFIVSPAGVVGREGVHWDTKNPFTR